MQSSWLTATMAAAAAATRKPAEFFLPFSRALWLHLWLLLLLLRLTLCWPACGSGCASANTHTLVGRSRRRERMRRKKRRRDGIKKRGEVQRGTRWRRRTLHLLVLSPGRRRRSHHSSRAAPCVARMAVAGAAAFRLPFGCQFEGQLWAGCLADWLGSGLSLSLSAGSASTTSSKFWLANSLPSTCARSLLANWLAGWLCHATCARTRARTRMEPRIRHEASPVSQPASRQAHRPLH